MSEEKGNRLEEKLNRNYIRKMEDKDRDRIRENVMEHSYLPPKEVKENELFRMRTITETCKRERNHEIYEDFLRGFDIVTLAMKYCLSKSRVNAIVKAEREKNKKYTNSGLLNELAERIDMSSALRIQTHLKRAGIFTLEDLLLYRGNVDMIPGIGRASLEVLDDIRRTLFVEKEDSGEGQQLRQTEKH